MRSTLRCVVLSRSARLFFGICFGFGLVASASEPAQVEVRIDPSVIHGTWDGWGTSLCWMGNVFGDRNDLADLLFTARKVEFCGQEIPGLRLNIVRYNAGACSWNEIDGKKMTLSKIIKRYRQIEGFWLDGKNPDPASPSWDWTVDAKQRAMLQKARDRGANLFELFSNSPMWWMCANGNPSGAPKASEDNLPERNHPAFAHYLATVAKIAKERWGIRFSSVAPFNEPMSHWWFADCKQEGCHFSHAAQARFLPILRAELDRQGLEDVIIAASDETHYDHAVETWKSLRPETKALVGRVNVHGYQLAGGRRDLLHRMVVKEDKKVLWNSEHGEKDATGLELARNLHRDMARLHPTAWCYWQPTDGGGWGMLECDMEQAEIRSVNPKIYVLAQYSRHILPGAKIMETGEEHTIAAYSAAAGKLVLITFNDAPARTFRYDLSGFHLAAGTVRSIRTEPKRAAKYEPQRDCTIESGRFSADLPAETIQTFEISGVSLPEAGGG